MQRYIFGLIFIFWGTFQLFSQSETTLPGDTAVSEEAGLAAFSKHSVFAGTGFGNDLLYTGSSLSDHQSFVSVNLTYSFMGKFWTSANVYNLPGMEAVLPLYDLSAGYNHVFNDYFDIAASLSWYHSSADFEELYGSFAYLRLSGGFDWFWIYTKLTTGSILGDNAGMYLYLRNSRYFRTATFGNSDNYISFDPNVNILFGNYSQIQPIIRNRGNNADRPGMGGPGPDSILSENSNQFTLLQTEFSVPVAFYFHDFTFEAEPLYLIPVTTDENNPMAKGFFFYLNVSYRIF